MTLDLPERATVEDAVHALAIPAGRRLPRGGPASLVLLLAGG